MTMCRGARPNTYAKFRRDDFLESLETLTQNFGRWFSRSATADAKPPAIGDVGGHSTFDVRTFTNPACQPAIRWYNACLIRALCRASAWPPGAGSVLGLCCWVFWCPLEVGPGTVTSSGNHLQPFCDCPCIIPGLLGSALDISGQAMKRLRRNSSCLSNSRERRCLFA
jgi:hypothetical protein